MPLKNKPCIAWMNPLSGEYAAASRQSISTSVTAAPIVPPNADRMSSERFFAPLRRIAASTMIKKTIAMIPPAGSVI